MIDWAQLGPKLPNILTQAAAQLRAHATKLRRYAEFYGARPGAMPETIGVFEGRAQALEDLAAEIETGTIMERLRGPQVAPVKLL